MHVILKMFFGLIISPLLSGSESKENYMLENISSFNGNVRSVLEQNRSQWPPQLIRKLIVDDLTFNKKKISHQNFYSRQIEWALYCVLWALESAPFEAGIQKGPFLTNDDSEYAQIARSMIADVIADPVFSDWAESQPLTNLVCDVSKDFKNVNPAKFAIIDYMLSQLDPEYSTHCICQLIMFKEAAALWFFEKFIHYFDPKEYDFLYSKMLQWASYFNREQVLDYMKRKFNLEEEGFITFAREVKLPAPALMRELCQGNKDVIRQEGFDVTHVDFEAHCFNEQRGGQRLMAFFADVRYKKCLIELLKKENLFEEVDDEEKSRCILEAFQSALWLANYDAVVLIHKKFGSELINLEELMNNWGENGPLYKHNMKSDYLKILEYAITNKILPIESYKNLICAAFENDDMEIFSYLLSNLDSMLTQNVEKMEFLRHLLTSAVSLGCPLPYIRSILQEGALTTGIGTQETTPLLEAIDRDQIDIETIKLLLKHHAYNDNQELRTAARQIAVQRNYQQVIDLLDNAESDEQEPPAKRQRKKI